MQTNCTSVVDNRVLQDQRTIAKIIELLRERDSSMKIVINVSGGQQRRIKIEVTRYCEVAE